MINKGNNLSSFDLRRRAAWFAVLPIALLQLSIAAHQFDHVAEYVDEPCYVCVQIDRLDDVAADQSITTPVPLAIDRSASPASESAGSPAIIGGFDPRAPPQL